MRRPILLALALIAAPAAAADRVHEHGRADLEVAMEGQGAVVTFASPLDNLVGFEHAPRTEMQARYAAKVEITLRSFGQLFKPSPEAGCKVTDTGFTRPARPDADGHAETEIQYILACSAPERLERIEVLVFEAFPRTQTIHARVAGPGGQATAQLSKTQRTLALQ